MHASIVREGLPGNAGDSQRSSTTGNHSQRGQRDIGGLAPLKEPVFIDMALVRMCKDELDAVNLCIDLSRLSDEAMCRVRNMTQRHLAAVAGLRPQLVTDYLNPDDKPSRRNLPAEQIKDFEDACGNTCVSQWLAARQRLTILEEMQAERNAA